MPPRDHRKNTPMNEFACAGDAEAHGAALSNLGAAAIPAYVAPTSPTPAPDAVGTPVDMVLPDTREKATTSSPGHGLPMDALGTSVDSTFTGTEGKERGPAPGGPVVPTVLSWILFIYSPLLCLPTWGWALWRAADRGWRSRLMAVLLCPLLAVPLYSAGAGLWGHFAGTPVLSSLDRSSQCHRRSREGSGHAPFTYLPGDLVRGWLAAHPAYDGPLPTTEEARTLLLAAKPTRVLPGAPAFVVDGRLLPIELLDVASRAGFRGGGDLPRCYLLALVAGRCLVIGEAGPNDPEEALLIDVEGLRTVARYHLCRDGW